MNILSWFVTSKWGLTILVVLALTAGTLAGAHFFAAHYYDKGRADCTADIVAQQAVENQRQARENVQRNADASVIANKADTAGEAAVKDTDTKTNSTKEVIRYVYLNAPTTKPVAGSCVHPVDKRVQDQFDKAVRAANG